MALCTCPVFVWTDCVCFVASNRPIRSPNEAEVAVPAVVDFPPAIITGLRVEEVDKGVSYEDGVSVVLAGATVSLHFYGSLYYIRALNRCLSIKHAACRDVPTLICPRQCNQIMLCVHIRVISYNLHIKFRPAGVCWHIDSSLSLSWWSMFY